MTDTTAIPDADAAVAGIYYAASVAGFFHTALGPLLPADAVAIDAQRHAALLAAQSAGLRIVAGDDGLPVVESPPPLSRPQREALLMASVKAHLDAVARAAGYDDMATAVSYADEPAVPRYQADALALRAWRSLVWRDALALMAAPFDLPDKTQLLGLLPPFPSLKAAP